MNILPRAERESEDPGTTQIVGLGASAGGLEALEQFLANVPVDSGLAYVVVQHLDPTHKAMLVELLQRATVMPVRGATESLRKARRQALSGIAWPAAGNRHGWRGHHFSGALGIDHSPVCVLSLWQCMQSLLYVVT